MKSGRSTYLTFGASLTVTVTYPNAAVGDDGVKLQYVPRYNAALSQLRRLVGGLEDGVTATISHTIVVWGIALGGVYLWQGIDAESFEPYFQLASVGIIIAIAL